MTQHVFAFEIEVPSTDSGAQTFYFSTDAFITTGSDTPANTVFRELVKDPGGVQRSVFRGEHTAGVVSPAVGDITLINTAGDFDDWLDYGTDGGKVTCRYGAKGAAYPSGFETVFVAYMYGPPLVNYRTMLLKLRSREWMFDEPIVTAGFDGSGGLEGESIAKGRLQQLIFGQPGPTKLIQLDPTENTWFGWANAPADYNRLYYGDNAPDYTPHDGGVPLLSNGTFANSTEFLNDPVDPGQYMHWVANGGAGPVYLKLGSKIKRELRYWPVGQIITDPGDSPNDPPRNWTVVDLAERRGIDATPLPDESVALDAGNRRVERQTYREVFDDIAAFELAMIGFNRTDAFCSRRIEPSYLGTDPYTFTFTDGVNSRKWDCSPIPGLASRVWRINVGAGATEKGVLAALDPTDTYRLEIADILRRESWMTRFTAKIPSIQTADPGAVTVDIQIQGNEFTDEASMEAWSEDFFALFGARTFCVTLEADFTTETMALDLLDRVYISSPRLGCTPSRTGRIVGIDYQLASRKIVFRIASQAVQSMTGLTLENVGPIGDELYLPPVPFPVACTDGTTAITTGLKKTLYFERDFRIERVAASLTTAQASGSLFTVDVKINDVSVFSTLLTFDNTEVKTSTATTPAVLNEANIEIKQGDKVTYHVTQVGNGTAVELTVTLIGYL